MDTNTRNPRKTPATRWLLLATLAGASLAVVGSAAAQQHGGKQGQGHGHGHGRGAHGMAFDRFDSNDDGVISRAEFDAHVAAREAAIDANGDGAVTYEEAKAFRDAQREARARARFQRLDKDGDGVVSTAETSARLVKMFDFLDANDDGQVDRDELPPRRGMRGR